LKYRLLPLSSELKEGNAVPIYLRLAHEQSDKSREYWFETPVPWNALPIDKIPLAEADKFLAGSRYRLRQMELGARRRTAEWNYTIDDGDPIGLLLPDAQWMRRYAHMLILQARVAVAKGDFPAAAHHLETIFAFARHVGEGPTLINRLVGIAIANQAAGVVADLVERPGAPNFYWALATLPRPLIDLRGAFEWEYRMLESQFPDLADLDRERTAGQWDAILRHFRASIHEFAVEGRERKVPDWFPKEYAPGDPAAKSPDLAVARGYVARTKHLTAEQVAAMPPARVLILHIVGTFHEVGDNVYRGIYLPPAQAWPVLEAADARLLAAPVSEGHVAARLFLPALPKVVLTQARLERHLAALRVVEALRMYAAAHNGRLPEKLADVTEAPVPDDPATGKPFEFGREGETATIVTGPVPGDANTRAGIRFRVTVRK
jgi:hypothetical protein